MLFPSLSSWGSNMHLHIRTHIRRTTGKSRIQTVHGCVVVVSICLDGRDVAVSSHICVYTSFLHLRFYFCFILLHTHSQNILARSKNTYSHTHASLMPKANCETPAPTKPLREGKIHIPDFNSFNTERINKMNATICLF